MCAANCVAAHSYEELECWQLATALKREVYVITDREIVAKDFKFRQQIRDSARSGPSNIAEGFGRFRPAEFARFLEIARASLMETQNPYHRRTRSPIHHRRRVHER